MCKRFFPGSCAANNINKKENIRLVVTSLDDCYAECKNEQKCKGFDLDSKGGCILAFQECKRTELVLHPIFEFDNNIRRTNMKFSDENDPADDYWLWKRFQAKKQLSYTYYPMSGCSSPGLNLHFMLFSHKASFKNAQKTAIRTF